MGLSYDLISEFVKITNDKKESTKEGTVYATVVGGTEGKYVQIDGSDLLTPMDTTTDIEDGERVTLMIKDHKAIVTGNVTTPSASTSKVDKVTKSINSVSDRVGTFELVVADKVSTKELEAYKATIEVLVASKATIEDLTATNAKIENLEVKNAEIENLVAEKATITDLEAVNATVENLKAKDAEIENAVVENLKATTADIKILNADFAQIKTLVNGNLTSDNILSFNLTSEKVTVDDAFIKDAMIDTISAGKINAGEINTNLVSIGSEDGGMLITGSTQQFTDKNGNVRIQIGKDASGDFTFVLYGEDGRGQLINQNGITASAISDGLIVNDMVSDHAAISGGKLDISSVITEINSDNSTTIQSSKIYLNDQAQSLEVAFNSLKTQVDTIQEVTIKGDLTAIVEQVQSNTSKIEANKNSINTLISEDTVIKKQVTDLQGTLSETETTLNSKYTSLSQNLDGFKTTVADTYATKKSVTDVVDNISANYSTTSVMNSAIEQKAQEISASVSSTYATKNQVSTLDNNLKSNYSTTQQMESAINIAKESINLGVSSIYETKENSTSKIQNAVNNIKVGGTNLVPGTKLLTAGINSPSFISSDTYLGFKIMHCNHTDDNYKDTYRFDSLINVEPNTEYTLSFYAKGKGYFTSFFWPDTVSNGRNSNGVTTNTPDGNINTTVTSEWKRYWITWKTLPDASGKKNVYVSRINKGNDIYICGVKFEKGNKATEWTPSPGDVDSNIYNAKQEAITSANNTLTSTIANYYTKSQTDSQINIAKESINLGVSNTYETKANVETKVTSTLKSAKSYADTKKTEAINTAASDATSKANTAKQEAITSANNNTSNVIKNYYTKAQTDSQINIAKEAINLGVSTNYETKTNVENKINGIRIGGRNYYLNSASFKMNANDTGTGTCALRTEESDKYYRATPATGKMVSLWKNIAKSSSFKPNGTDNYIISLMVRSQKDATISLYDDILGSTKTDTVLKAGVWTRISTKPQPITDSKNMILRSSVKDSYLDYKMAQLECGTISSTWVSAPEDVQASIDNKANSVDVYTKTQVYTKDETNSQINIAKEEINLGVSTNYETKKNVETKVTSTLNSAKSYADTKKTEAINTAASDATSKANTAKQEAITSANNNTSNVIKNYYTKAQTDSQINIAKEEINLGVSTNYETKENVQSKVTSTLKSAKSYADTKKTEAINTAASDATSKANKAKTDAITSANNNTSTVIKNYYTKEQTDSQINIAKEAINLGVSTNYETKTNVETKYNNATSIAKAMDSGKILYEDIAFRKGNNNVVSYNTAGNSNVKVERITKPSDCPTTSTHCIRVTTTGTAAPGWGGFYQRIQSRANAVFIQKFVAKLPVGYVLGTARNDMGDGCSDKWLTSNKGTGKWETYIRQTICGSTGGFSSGGHVFVSGGTTPTTSAPLVWYIASCTAIDITDTDERVNSLTTRISTAESKITDDAITTTVKKNFYTKEQTDSQINIAKEAINLGVSTNYETKENVQSKVTSTLNSAKSYADTKKTEAINTAASDATSKANKAKSDAITSANNNTSTVIKNYYTKEQTDSQINIAKEAINLGISNTYETKSNVTTKISNAVVEARTIPDTRDTNENPQWYMTNYPKQTISEFKYAKKIGIPNSTANYGTLTTNVPWGDNTGGYPTQTFRSSNYKTYERKGTSATQWSKWIQIENAIDSQAKADTAKNEAITSANNTLTSTIANYYTKEQTDSQINVAKNAITQSVSSTYATKSNVTSSINGVNSSITNLQNRMNSAESKITDTAITNTVKKNFYTKTETENAITSKGYATQSQVQQTTNEIIFKFSESGGHNLIRNGGFEKGLLHWSTNNNPSIIENQTWQNHSGKTIFITGTASNSGIYQFFPTIPGKTYSYSFYAQAEYGTWYAGVENRHAQDIAVSPNDWRHYTGTFTATNTEHAFICYAHGSDRNVFIDNVMICEGWYPSEYTPHPSEIYDGITTIDKTGVRVSASNMNGYTHMTEYGFYVNKDGKDLVTVDRYGLKLFDAKIQLTHANGNKYFLLDENGINMYNPANGTHQWGKVAAINSKFTIASNGNSSGLSLGHHVDENYIEDILCDSYGVVTVQRQINHNGIFYNNYGQMFIRQSGQSGWEITGRSDSQSIKPGGANQGGIGSNTQYINQSWIANRYNPSSIEVKHVSHYVEDNECISLVNGVKPARYFYKEYDDEGNDITTFSSRSSQLGLIYEDVRECSARDLITNEEDKGINLYGMVSTLWGATRNLNTRLNDAEYEIVLLKEELEQLKNKLGEK